MSNFELLSPYLCNVNDFPYCNSSFSLQVEDHSDSILVYDVSLPKEGERRGAHPRKPLSVSYSPYFLVLKIQNCISSLMNLHDTDIITLFLSIYNYLQLLYRDVKGI